MCQAHTGAFVSLLTPGETDYQVYRLPPKKDYHVYIARSTYHYANARQTQVNWKKKTKKRKKDKGMGRKNNEAKKRNREKRKRKTRKARKTRQEEEARKGTEKKMPY